jgi:hypothetical protein
MIAINQRRETQHSVINIQDYWEQLRVFDDFSEFLHLAVFQVEIDYLATGENGVLVEGFEVDFGGRQSGVGEWAL